MRCVVFCWDAVYPLILLQHIKPHFCINKVMQKNEAKICDYGCRADALFTLKNGKQCCSEHPRFCLGFRQKSSERLHDLNKRLQSPATQKGFKQPTQECTFCEKSFSVGNYKKHIAVCGKPKGQCQNCGKDLFTYSKTCSKDCAREAQSKRRIREVRSKGLTARTCQFPYIRNDGTVILLESSYELSCAVILDIWKHFGKIRDWEYNRTEYFTYSALDGKERSYFPDFKVLDDSGVRWIETKGHKTPSDDLKWNAANEQDIRLEVWFDVDIKRYQDGISGYTDNKD
jgi:hypothetical protein